MRNFLVLFSAFLIGCDPAPGGDELRAATDLCEIVQPVMPLAEGLEESSGVVVSRRDPGILWTHNDFGWPAEIVSITPSGQLISRVGIAGATSFDWEDIAFGPCPQGECLYIGDIGDNQAVRENITVFRLPEPASSAGEARVTDRFDMRYPDGGRDAESLFVLPTGELYLVTKGVHRRAELFRYPLPLRAGETVALEPVIPLSPGPLDLLEQLTAADVSPSGDWLAIRSYQSIAFYRPASLIGGDTVPAYRFDLEDVEEVQGEGLALLDDGTVYLTGEGGFEGARGTIAILRCRLP
ncbi:hypothetical protein BH23GEM6_BH23GEM6_23490 [soil metagenome]